MPITIHGERGLNKACSTPQSKPSPNFEINPSMDDELSSIGFIKLIKPEQPELAENLQHPLWPELDQFVQSHNNDAKEMARLYIKERIQTILQVAPSLTTMMAWIQYQMWGELPESVIEVALAKSQDAFGLVDQLWQGEDSLLQTTLLRTHSAVEVWPTSKVFTKALNAFYKNSPKTIQLILDQSIKDQRRTLFWHLSHDYKYAVVNLPVLCGFWSMSTVPMAWWSHHPERQRFIQQLLSFDPIWFQVAFNQGCKIALALDAQYEFNRE